MNCNVTDCALTQGSIGIIPCLLRQRRRLTLRLAPYTRTSLSLLNALHSFTSRTSALYWALSLPMLGDKRFTATFLPRHTAAYTLPKPPEPYTSQRMFMLSNYDVKGSRLFQEDQEEIHPQANLQESYQTLLKCRRYLSLVIHVHVYIRGGG